MFVTFSLTGSVPRLFASAFISASFTDSIPGYITYISIHTYLNSVITFPHTNIELDLASHCKCAAHMVMSEQQV